MNRLTVHGIQIKSKSYCKEDALLGRFFAETRVLEICPLGAFGQQRLMQTLNHEAVHAVQNCIGRRIGVPFLSIKEVLSKGGSYNLSNEFGEAVASRLIEKDKLAHVLNVTHHGNRITEAEAYALEDDTWAVIGLLNEVCGSSNSPR